MAAPLGTATAGATSERVVAAALREAGLAVSGTGGSLIVPVERVDAVVLVTEHPGGDGTAPLRFLLPMCEEAGAICVQVVVFLGAGGEPAGTALVVGEATLADTSPQTDAGWEVTVTPAVSDTPRLPLDVCVVPLAEIGPWVRAEVADSADADAGD